jgi:hypothetical protein
VVDTGVTMADEYAGVFGDEQTCRPEGAATEANWVCPGG